PDRLVYETAADGSGATTEVSITVLPPPAALKLELPRGAVFRPGQTIPLSWAVQGDDQDAPLLVRAQEPGTLDATTAPDAQQPGARPPNGPSHYLRPDGAWMDAATVYAPRASSGAATIALPTDAVGAWRIELLLQDPLTGGIRASSGQPLLVADRPAIFLTVSPPLARPGARIQAGLLVNPVAAPDGVRVLAGLTRPDGADVLLDSNTVERSGAGLIELPERPLGADLPG